MESGCGTTFKVNHYPVFYKPSIESVAVLPFENETSRKGIGRAVAEHLSAALSANGTYKITGPAPLEKILKENNISKLPTNDYRAVAKDHVENGKSY